MIEEKLMRKSTIVTLVLMLVAGQACQGDQKGKQETGGATNGASEQISSNKFSSAEKTWSTLVEAATNNDTRTFVSGVDFVPMMQALGVGAREIETFVKTIRERIEDPQYSEFKSLVEGLMESLTSQNHAILNEEQAGLNTRLLLIKSIPKAGSGYYRESTSTWYFTRRDQKWLLNFELTKAKS